MRGLSRTAAIIRTGSGLGAVIAVVGGGVALFTTDNSAGSLLLIGVGILLGLFAALGPRLEIESFEVLGAKVKVREVIKSRIALAQAAEGGADDARAEAMRAQALALRELYDLYEYVRRTEPASDDRTTTQDRLVLRMRNASTDFRFDRAEVVSWFEEGDGPLRLIAISVMQAREDCRYFPVVLKALERPYSLNEQYQALRLGDEMSGGLDRLERKLFRNAILRAQQQRRFKNDGPLMAISDRILRDLATRQRRHKTETRAPP
jgi:hypothetical protein